MVLEWTDLYLSALNRNKNISTEYIDLIKHTSGSVEHGEILAIMGPSGSGKSTLLNMLSGRVQTGAITQGSIRYNGKQRTLGKWMMDAGFVEQEAYLMEEFTIKQNLTYSYKFNNNKRSTASQLFELQDKDLILGKNTCENTVNNVICDMNLEDVALTIAKKLSGGERKRVSIGATLVKDPLVLLLDEPTSGLDMDNALQICQNLKELAVNKKMIVILTIHQPNQFIYSLFDKLLLLSDGGVLYYGDSHEVEEYFLGNGVTKHLLFSTPDFIIQIAGKKFKKDNPELFIKSIFKGKTVIKNEDLMIKYNKKIIDIRPSAKDVLLLLKREGNLILHRKKQLIKSCIFRLLCSFCFIWVLWFIFSLILDMKTLLNDRMQNEEDIQKYKNMSTNNEMDEDEIRKNVNAYIRKNVNTQNKGAEYKKYMIRNLANIFTYLSIFIFLLQILYSTPIYFDKIRENSFELRYWYYSASSLFIYLILSQILFELFISFFTYLFFIYMFRVNNFYTAVYFLTAPFVIQPFCFFISSIASNRTLVILFSFLIGGLSLIPAGFIKTAIKGCLMSTNSLTQKLPYLTFLFFILIPSLYLAILFFMLEKSQEVDPEDLKKYLTIVHGITFSPFALGILMPILCIILVLIGTVINGIRVPMHIRLKTENNMLK